MGGGLIVRLIDIVLIILFGFIAISDIQVKRQIKLPGANENQQEDKQDDIVMLQVDIDAEGQYSLKSGESVLMGKNSLADLENALVRQVNRVHSQNKTAVVIIDPQAEARVQETVSVIDICEKHGFLKSININKALNSNE